MMVQQSAGSTIKCILCVKNIDAVDHTLGLGFTFDPAIGNNGDGFAKFGNHFLQQDTLINTSVPSLIQLWERDNSPTGIGVEFAFNSGAPAQIVMANWDEMQADLAWVPGNVQLIYDLCVQAKWGTQIVSSGQEIQFDFNINLLQPEFNSNAFLRWDMPSKLSVEQNVLFPLEQSTYVEVYNPNASALTQNKLHLTDSVMSSTWISSTSFNVNANDMIIKSVPVSISEYYHDTIIEVHLKLEQNSIVKDVLKRRVFIPAAPVSNTGLDITIDSISTFSYPEVQVFFDARNEITGQLLNNLKPINVFPEEDNSPVQNFTLMKDTAGGVNQADIAIILDVTGSMDGEIADVRDNIIEFADSLVQNGIDVRLGAVTFRDEIADIYPFTNNVINFQQFIAQQSATGGADESENSLEALYSGCQLAFRPDANRIFIWITDAPYHIAPNVNTNLSVNDVVSELIANSVKVYAIAPANLQTQWFDQIVLNTGGDFYDINGNFRDVLLQISRMSGSNRYVLKYSTTAQLYQMHTIKVEVHSMGLGGYDIVNFNFQKAPTLITCYPNPAKDYLQIEVNNPDKKRCCLIVRDQAGRVLKSTVLGNQSLISTEWLIGNLKEQKLKNGIYFFQVIYTDNQNNSSSEVCKVIITH